MALWQQITDQIRADINAGRYPAGDLMPREVDLAQVYKVSKDTIHKALAHLETEGLVVQTQGRGTLVRAHRRRQRVTLDSTVRRDELGYFFGTATQSLRALQPPTVTEGPCPLDLVPVLGLAPGSSVVIRDRVMGDPDTGQTAQLATSYLPADLAAGTVLAEADTGPGGIYDRMEQDLGWGHLEWHVAVSARAATPDEVRLLDLAPGVPVLCVTRVTTATAGAAAGRVVEVNVTRRDASMWEVGHPITRV
ncbi:GntR family transcriptional regulator [Streptosporangium becharense]|uniref:GntR family transcriptional regulator n=1 Tax=Streptosporangium becharense TaxID=1816182 RepID=A0A7W9IN61_9ACTN|nr:GntR family transcriptional regulator [Streptosporangium becharense]MBB2909340.1 GntR family transcriptional regulator [Streptosporangium becharense]MBB5823757.1 GntR family transcriptional regulator [Streptosporangium becharense]